MAKSSTADPPSSINERVVDSLAKLGPGDRARLKRNAGQTIAESHGGAASVFFQIYPPREQDRQEEIFFLVATLYGLNDRTLVGDFGTTMRILRGKSSSPEGLDRRMSILLDAEFDLIDGFRPGGGEFAYRLRQCIKLAASKEVGVDWAQLLKDLPWWTHPEKRVRKRWARSYFSESSPSSFNDMTNSSQGD